jgi:hypothetical protein
MRHIFGLLALPALALAAPASAQDIVFVPGTGVSNAAEPEATFDDQYADAETENTSRPRNDDIDAIADRRSDPEMQDKIAYTVERMADAVLAMPIGGVAEAIESARPGTVRRSVRRDDTVRDLAGRDGDYLAEDLGDRSREIVSMMGSLARAAATMAPALAQMGRELEESYRAAKGDTQRREYR